VISQISVWIAFLAFVCAGALAVQKFKGVPDGTVLVVLKTDAGEIEIAVDMQHAPVTSANFLKYVDAGYYDGGTFHRTVKMGNQPDKKVKIEVIQAGAEKSHDSAFGKIPLERTNKTGLKHLNGTISMARDEADTATSDFFICINDQPELDFGGKRNPDGQGFAAFGKVIRGMDVVRKIQQSAADGQKLTPPIKIISAKRMAPQK
jgi:peptidyl-prolyl cis-trans isomerase A (cyclophilin A)